jgi:hypothetical protein
MPAPDPLAQLRDIHLPAAIGQWPPAPGWWILAGLLLLMMGYGLFRFLRYQQHNNYRRLALLELEQLQQFRQQPVQYLQQLNQLLKQTALATSNTNSIADHIAALSGQRWLTFLDLSSNSEQFCNGAGQVLATGPYSASEQNYDHDALLQLCQRWIKKHRLSNTAIAKGVAS